jgi:bacteriocin resistance YdeI/OmpD-like protein
MVIIFSEIFFMANPVAQKLKVKEGYQLRTINAPSTFKENLGRLPVGVKISDDSKIYNQLHWFVSNKAQMDKELNKVLKLLKDDVVLWIYYPKGSSKLQTDLTRDKGWDSLMKHDNLTWISLISFDETWSTFGARLKTDADKKKEGRPREREIFNWVNPETKEVKLPTDVATALKKNKKQQNFFNALSFTNKKEYLEWILTAKREETRNERINGTIERLGKGWKNPRNI